MFSEGISTECWAWVTLQVLSGGAHRVFLFPRRNHLILVTGFRLHLLLPACNPTSSQPRYGQSPGHWADGST